jgi:2-phospho-L-lactate/phosphoenolpyruvate guanylyltransferase
VQATVADFLPDGSGSVLLDDGTRLEFAPAAFAASGLRLLRSGQRVKLRTEGSGAERRVTALTIATLPWEESPPGGR